MANRKPMQIKSPPRITKVKCAGPVETVEEFIARGGKVQKLEQKKEPPAPGAIPVGFGRGWMREALT